jgi:flagellar biosynthesis protein FlhG
LNDQASQLRELAQRFGTPSSAPASASASAVATSAPAATAPLRPRSAAAVPSVSAPADPPRLARAIAVTSGKGGVGKSNLSVNLAVCLARRGLRTCLLDADLGMANADVLCGLNPPATLEAVIRGERRLSEVVVEGPGGFLLVPGASGVGRLANLTVPEQQRLVSQLRSLERTVDLVIIDTGAGIGSGVMTFAAAAGITLVAATPEPTSMTDAYGAIKTLAIEVPDATPRLVVNMAASPQEAREVHERIDRVSRRFLGRGVGFAGAIPLDPGLPAAVRRQRPLAFTTPDSPAAAAIDRIAENLAAELHRDRAATPQAGGFLQRLAGWIGLAR